MYRNWTLFKDFNNSHSKLLKKARELDKEGAEYYDIHSEVAQVDIEYFPVYLRGSMLSISLSLLENLLQELAVQISNDLNKPIELDKRPLPYINKYLLWFTRGCGLEIPMTKDLYKKLDAIREIRNRFIHNVSREIPDNIKKTIKTMMKDLSSDEVQVTDEFVDKSLYEISNIVKIIELSYSKHQNNLTNNR